ALAAANNTPLNLSEIALGDGNGSVPVPGPSSTLVNEVYRASINSITPHQINPGWYVIELILPPDVGGFWIREMAVYDDNGDAIYLGNHAPEYKPLLSEGSTRDTIIRVIVETSNAAEITLIVDPNVVTATHDYVLAQFSSHVAETDPHPQYALKVGVQEQRYTAFTTTGTAPDFVGSVTPALTAYVAGQRFRVKFHNHINSSATLNINGLGALSLKQYEADGSKVGAVVGINQLVDVEYDGTDFVVLNSTSVGRGALSKDVSGNSDVTLTRVESANEVIILTGALTGNISVIMQRSHIRTWVIRNLTTGAFTVNVKTQSGTGVICDQNNNTHVFTDGVNVYNSMSGMRGIKYPVRLATIANIADLASGAPDTLDGISLVKNDRILVKSQTTKSQNGIYIVSTVGTGSDGTWVRAGDSDESPE
ncbi:phage tail protein, partial [Nitrosomonas marina]